MEEQKYYISMKDHEDAVKLSGDENPIHRIQNYMMGAHLLSLIKVHPEIKNQYIQYMRIGFKGSVIMNPVGNTISCKIKKARESSDFTYTIEIEEDGKLVLEGFTKTTNNYDVFKYEAKEKLKSRLKKGIENCKIADLNINEEKIKEYERIIYSRNGGDEEHSKIHDDSSIIPSYYPIFFMPAEIIRILKDYVGKIDNGKKYLYGGSEMEFYSDGVSSKNLQIIGKIPDNFGMKSRHHIDTFISGLEGIVASNRITALAIS